MIEDKLDLMFKHQTKLQQSLRVKFDQGYYNIMTLALIDEAMESLRETPWKPWKNKQKLNKVLLKEELVDLFHFFMNLCIFAGMSSLELYQKYMIKNEENFKRQKDGY